VPAIAFPRSQLAALQDLAARVVESRQLGGDRDMLARDLLVGFFDVCMRSGLDRVLVDLAKAFPPLDISDRMSLLEHPTLRAALLEKLGNKVDFDEGGPRNAKPRMLAECLVQTLSLSLTDEPEPTVTLGDDVRAELTAAITSVVEADFAAAPLRAAVIASAREKCDPQFLDAFDKIAAQLDDRGMRMVRQPKVRLDAVQAVQQALAEARHAVVARIARAAIERASQVLGRADKAVAARIDKPISLRLTVRDVAIERACEARVPKVPSSVVHSLFESLSELLHLVWRAAERPVRPYAASQTFAVGEIVEHPKFGRGSVTTCDTRRIEVAFPDGPHTLAHVGPTK